MNKTEAVLRYKTSMAVFRKWRSDGIITDADLLALCTTFADKYGLSSCSIFRDNDLTYPVYNGIYSSRNYAKGDRS